MLAPGISAPSNNSQLGVPTTDLQKSHLEFSKKQNKTPLCLVAFSGDISKVGGGMLAKADHKALRVFNDSASTHTLVRREVNNNFQASLQSSRL